MHLLALSLFLLVAPVTDQTVHLTGNVSPAPKTEATPNPSEVPLKTPDSDDDVIIMEEDSDYEENESEDSDPHDEEYHENATDVKHSG
ncbi:MAG: hypothetical protein NTX49_07960 [Chlamydiae bacterium]|nr:hypothetical protein [Chlamydiota bacterium]